MVDEIAETILPETSTPGAKAAKTGAFMALMVMRYRESPGRFDPCAPHAPGDKIWVSHDVSVNFEGDDDHARRRLLCDRSILHCALSLVRESVDHVIDAEFVGLVRGIERK